MKTYLALVTFDLHGIDNKDSNRIYTELSTRLVKLNLIKSIFSPIRGHDISLPSNTYTGFFKAGAKYQSSSALRAYLKKSVKQSIKAMSLKATVFILVGRSWAWGKSNIK